MIREPVLELCAAKFDYAGREVLTGVDLTVERGEFLGLLGPNGAGKSTVLRLAVGLLRPTGGSVRLFGETTGRFKEWGRVGYVSQHAAQLEAGFPATVREVIAAGRVARRGWMRRMTPMDRQAVDIALELTGLRDLHKRPVSLLSGGQRQRLAIGRVLAASPELMLLDEPSSGIDAAAREGFYDLLDNLHKEAKLTLVLVSHDLDAVMTRADRVVWLYRRVLFQGRPGEFPGGELPGWPGLSGLGLPGLSNMSGLPGILGPSRQSGRLGMIGANGITPRDGHRKEGGNAVAGNSSV